MKIIEIEAKSALRKLKNKKFPYKWDLNIYRGCIHKCEYCYAMYSHKYLDEDNFFDTVYVKTNIVEILEKELSKKSWKKETVNIGSVCDSYQGIEKDYGLMREVLNLFIKYETPIVISTKSNLILRDIDLINELSKITYVGIGVTITTGSDKVASILEPGACSVSERLNVLIELKKRTNARVGMHVMPIIPYVTDQKKNLEYLIYKASKFNLDYVLCGSVNLRSETKKSFYRFMENRYGNIYNKFVALYKDRELYKKYKKELYSMVNSLKKKYNVK
jgi:DNA repair photolyase